MKSEHITKPYAIERYFVETRDQRDDGHNGRLISLWKHWEDERPLPPMELYSTSFLPGVLKGPHLHMTRWDFFSCVHGMVVTIVRDYEGKYHEFMHGPDHPRVVVVPANMPSATMNLSSEVSVMLNLCNPAWHPDNEDNFDVSFDDYDFDKWREHIGGQ